MNALNKNTGKRIVMKVEVTYWQITDNSFTDDYDCETHSGDVEDHWWADEDGNKCKDSGLTFVR